MVRKGNPILLRQSIIMPILIERFWLLLAGAAWSFDFPYFLSSALCSVIYYSLLYLFLFIDMKYSVYARTIHLKKKLFFKEKESIHFFQKTCFLLWCFLFFILCSHYFINFNYHCNDLINPLQALAQLSLFIFHYKFKKTDVRERHLTLLSFFLSVLSTLHLKGINFGFPSFIVLLFSLFTYMFFQDYAPLGILLFYSLDAGLAKWGFYLLFQQVAFYALSISLDKDQTVPPKKVIITQIFFLYMQFSMGLFFYKDLYFLEPSNLALLLSGASIIFICIKKRKKKAFLCSFFLYFVISLAIGVVSSLGTGTSLDYFGLLIFIFCHITFLFGLKLFIYSKNKQALVPFFFYGLFYLLPCFPHMECFSRWIEGFDLLLFFLSFFSSIEDLGASRGSRKKRGTKHKPDKRRR